MSRIWPIVRAIESQDKSHLRHQYRPEQVRRLELALFAGYWFLAGVVAGWIVRGWMR